MKKTILRLVAVVFGALLVGQTIYVEYLFHTGSVSLANAPEIAECALVWVVVLAGVTALLVRRATPAVMNHVVNNYNSHDDECDDDCDDDDDE